MQLARDHKGRFQSTQWDVVQMAAGLEEAQRLQALDHLLRQYVPTLVEFLQ